MVFLVIMVEWYDGLRRDRYRMVRWTSSWEWYDALRFYRGSIARWASP